MSERYDFFIEDTNTKNRLDKYLSEMLDGYTRSHIQKWITEGQVTVNDKVQKANYKLRLNDSVTVLVPEAVAVAIEPVPMDLDIIYEDLDLLIVNKPVDMVVHPAPGHFNDTLVNGIMHHCKDQLSGINGELRPGIVHRIDKDTTGLLVVCKNDTAHVSLASQLKAHSIDRIYHAIVYNNVKEDVGTIEGPIGRHPTRRKEMAINPANGKPAVTHYKVIERLKNGFTYVELRLETGRTHQIRVHMTSMGHPLLGDPLYGPKNSPYKLPGQMLHAKTLGFIHPRTGDYVSFDSELSNDFKKALSLLRI